MRIMGLDVGDRTIGVAVSDDLGWTAQGVEVIRRKSLEHDLSRLEELVKSHNVEKILVGMPRNMNGTYGPRAELTKQFIEILGERIHLPIVTWDERLSTVSAERALIQADVSRSKRKGVIDKVAAVVILQAYLDSKPSH